MAYPSVYLLTSKTVTDYDHHVATTTTYGYDSALRTLEPVSETTTNSRNESLTTSYTYPQTAGTAYQDLTAANMHIPVETSISRSGSVIRRTKSSYTLLDGIILTTAYYEGKGDAAPEQRIQYGYDSYGNLAYVLKDGTVKTVYLWSYKGLYPVAKIEGMTMSSVYSALGSTVDTLLTGTSDATVYSICSNPTIAAYGLATAYTWKPLVGVTSVRKPNLETAFYTYDSMGRLSSAKNNSGDVIESYAYSYGGTPATNYVRTRTMKNASGSSYRDSYDYFDGIGQKVETVACGLSPQGGDLVTLTEYDALGRPVREWLPTVFTGSGTYVETSAYRSASRTYYNNDSRPYTLTEYEACPSDKVLRKYGPGAEWQNAGKAVATVYTGNQAGNVRIYSAADDDASLTADGTYDANQLFTVQTTDEDGNVSYTFTDKEGRLILERRMAGSARYDTYYVYDRYGNLAFVLPPSVSLIFVSGTWSITTSSILQRYAYNYRYDSRNRCIEKKLPGCDKVTMTYDTADRLVGTQDGVQRTTGASTYYEYDAYSRQTAMGSMNSAGVKTPLLINYYDSYDFTSASGGLSLDNSAGADTAFPTNAAPNGRGRLTGIRATDLTGSSSQFYTSYYYGERDRLVQSHCMNDVGGFDDEYYTYNFAGTIATRKLTHSRTGMPAQTEFYTYTYDVADRLTNVSHRLNSNSTVALTVNTYDAVGRLLTKKPMNAETVTYTYNVRNWPTGISSTHFTEVLAYNTASGSLSPSTARWGGNVAAMSWKAGDESSLRTYQFDYNALDWLTSASYTGTGNYTTQYTYNMMGNFTSLTRSGLQDGGSYGLIDNLTFTYQGNQIKRIDDSETDPTYNGAFNFVDGISANTEYEYDQNGNMTKDLNRGITSISYNRLNLPQTVSLTGQRQAIYGYDATGRKLREIYTRPGLAADTTHLCSNLRYKGNTLQQIYVDDGYITLSGSVPTYHYYLKDHLGNNRVVCTSAGTVEQVNHYYPFGGLFGESTGANVQLYKYNGKELERMHGLDWYDYGARHLSADIGRFNTMDPMAEKKPWLSPYVYGRNNPIRFIDPDGKNDWDKLMGYFIGMATNIIPIHNARNWYPPTDVSDYNVALQSTDNAFMAMGGSMVDAGKGGAAIGTSVAATSGIFVAGSGGTAAVIGASAVVAGATLTGVSTAVGTAGAIMQMNAANNKRGGYEKAKNNSLKGTPVNSKTIWNSNGKDNARIDVENPKGRLGQIHIHVGNKKYNYNSKDKSFIDAPKKVNELLKREDVQNAIRKGQKYLGE